MKGFTKWGLVSAVAIGMFVYANRQPVHVSAAAQFYAVPDVNQNIQQENAGNALQSGTSASSASSNNSGAMTSQVSAGQTISSKPPYVPKPKTYVNSPVLDANTNNAGNDYKSINTSNELQTYYYLPAGFHVKNTEHGNYQSSVQVDGNIYVVESMGTGTNQGAIVKYNTNDLKQLGVLNSDGSASDGKDLIWKALNYISPYTSKGNEHTNQYNDYQSLVDNANNSIKDNQNTINSNKQLLKDNAKKIVASNNDIKKTTKLSQAYLKVVSKQIKGIYNSKQKVKNPIKSKTLNMNNYNGFFNNVIATYQKPLDKITQKQDNANLAYAYFKGIYNGHGKYKNFKTFDKYLKARQKKAKLVLAKSSAASSAASVQASLANSANSNATSTSSANSSVTNSSYSYSAATKIEQSEKAFLNYKINKKQFNQIHKLKKAQFNLEKIKYNKQSTKLINQAKTYQVLINPAEKYLNNLNKKYMRRINNQKVKISNMKKTNQQAIKDNKTANDSIKGINKTINELTNNKDLYAKYSSIAHAGQISPLINIGHGQTLSYNPATKNIYLAQDETTGDIDNNAYNTVTELDSNTLQPIKQFNFQLKNDKTNMGVHTLTFDNAGNAYFGRKQGNKYQIYKGQFNETNGNVTFAPVPQLINWGGYHNQGLSYNANNNRLYIVSDDIITSVPVDKLGQGTLTSDDIHYTAFNSGREFESLSFDNDGYGYLLALRVPEILKSTQPMD